ncbi:hypothetical protein BCR39DRAFT_519186 [Naematelia encephala]|uniref:Non-haem dioxygenase N-terminal domain-containing protein n=1 Tax=Naematelia encephala TaxID=71784 RepID=A0A1Y2BI49_9TREE|nr:hypothetical protein BCR39DRAFT_519186 [Naematelia encephala]
MSAQPVTVSYPTLIADPTSLLPQIERAFGSSPGSLGIIVVSDLPPDFIKLRETLFHGAHALANLPESSRDALARPDTSYMFGWSHGKEVMNGRPDTMKGSFYANPMVDLPNVSAEKRKAHPEYYSGNVWPSDHTLSDFEPSFKALGEIIFNVGVALAKACEPFAAPQIALSGGKTLAALISESQCNKARLLHYYPETGSSDDQDRIANDALCGTHVDHSLLTGLCSAMYLASSNSSSSPTPTPVQAPSPTAGLWIHPRHHSATNAPIPDPVKVSIPPNCLAFQTGETLEILTDGKLAATPHFVSGNAGSSTGDSKVSRETFAFFLQYVQSLCLSQSSIYSFAMTFQADPTFIGQT